MSIYDMKGVTILVGMTSLTDVQMTRRPTKIVLHSKFNAFTYVSCYKTTMDCYLFFILFIPFHLILIRPMISPS